MGRTTGGIHPPAPAQAVVGAPAQAVVEAAVRVVVEAAVRVVVEALSAGVKEPPLSSLSP
jgi:hypothetical protein